MSGNNQLCGNLNPNFFNVTPWNCEICNGYFFQKCSLQRHMRDVHSEQCAWYTRPEEGCYYTTKHQADLLHHHRAHLKQASNASTKPQGKSISHVQQKTGMTRFNPLQASSSSSETVSTPQESNYQFSPFNTVNMNAFGQMIGGLAKNNNPTSTSNNQSASFNFTAENCSTAVTYYQPTRQEPQSL